MSFIPGRRTLGAKLESTPYTAETLTADNFNIQVYNINYTPEIPKKDRKIARGDFSRDPSVTGKRAITITGSVDVYHSDTNTTPPNYFLLLRACGMKQVIGASGVTLTTDSDYTNVPLTMEVVEKDEGTSPSQLVYKAKGCMGNATIVVENVGEPARIDFEFKGCLVSVTDRAYGSILAPSGISTVVPDSVMSSGVTLFGETQCLNTYTINLNNTVELYTCPGEPTGYKGAHITDRHPTLEMDPDLELIATQGDYARWTENTTGAFSSTIGSIGDEITLSAPAAQYSNAYQPGEREGHTVNNKTLELKRSSGNDEFKIVHGEE